MGVVGRGGEVRRLSDADCAIDDEEWRCVPASEEGSRMKGQEAGSKRGSAERSSALLSVEVR